MKLAIWILILAVTIWSLDNDRWITQALAATTTSYNTSVRTTTTTRTAQNGFVFTVVTFETVTTTNVSTLTSTNSDGPSTNTKTGSNTDTNCHTGGGQYGGGQWNWCNRTDPNTQRKDQDDTKDMNNNGANKSTALGLAAIAAGMAMVAAGMALLPNPPTTPIGVALIAAGMALIAAGLAALAAAKKMNDNANKAGNNAYKHDSLTNPYKSTISDGKGGNGTGTSSLGDVAKADLGDGNTSGIKIDPALTRSGKMDGIYGDMEKKTGINRDDFLNAMNNGADPLKLLSDSPALRGKASASEGNLQKMMDDTLAKGNLPSGEEVMDKLGLTKEDLGGGDSNRGLASSTSGPNVDALFPDRGPAAGPNAGTGPGDFKLSPEVQAALDKRGITGRTLFEMIHSQYVKKTPLMFGVQPKKDGTASNPYSSLLNDKVDL